MTYSKRVDCHPPAGRGELTYILWDLNTERLPNGQPIRRTVLERDSRAAGGSDVTLPDYSTVPVGELLPGSYAFQWLATYHCANARRVQNVEGPLLYFEVVGK